MATKKFKSVDEYFSSVPKESKEMLTKLRKTIREVVPKAEEVISYNIPAFCNERPIVYIAGFKKHVSLFPAPRGAEEFKEALAKYKGGKGTIQFPIDKPLPITLIKKIVKYRVKENEMRVKGKKKS